uniref:Uncharacterized protein n=1 Tax=Bracon brevicornis TaxID=1563983 RepID=A0A6V7M338_9HYME
MDQLGTELLALYRSTRSIDSLQAGMSQLEPKEGEKVGSYGLRAEEVTSELMDELLKGIPDCAEQLAIGRAIGECAKANFVSGIKTDIKITNSVSSLC